MIYYIHVIIVLYFQLTRVTSLVTLGFGGESVLVPPTASVDEPLASHGGTVVEVAREIGQTQATLWWLAANVHTSSLSARYLTRAGTCTAGREQYTSTHV